jgi:hypothetical protein
MRIDDPDVGRPMRIEKRIDMIEARRTTVIPARR